MSDPIPVLHDLGDPTRVRVLQVILGGRRNVSQIVSRLGLSQPQVSYHLRKLREAGLAVVEKDGRWVWYQANWETRDARARELLELLARWSRVGSKAQGAPAHRQRERAGSAHRDVAGRLPPAAAPARPVEAPEVSRPPEEGADDRPVVERPVRKKPTDMDDFLL